MPDPTLETLVAIRSGEYLPVYDADPGDEDDSAAKERERMPWRILKAPPMDDEERDRLMEYLREQCQESPVFADPDVELSLVWPKPASWEWRAR